MLMKASRRVPKRPLSQPVTTLMHICTPAGTTMINPASVGDIFFSSIR